ncbi:MAG: 1,3-beta-galactosyl-N-acetylhexosamine phosphorylase [Clostridiales bacterium]|jgi:beta-D-galactosyl-(1->4)-L-rhamnose phosphorylase|nr:1,3-beta-galactosyl-N-acetylhexosamine phosphorylase [Clostridiales bacterium]
MGRDGGRCENDDRRGDGGNYGSDGNGGCGCGGNGRYGDGGNYGDGIRDDGRCGDSIHGDGGGYGKGDFTLPGESGYEALTLALAEKWGADVIRDSDGTKLSAELLASGYGIYSTVCVIRDHNDWARRNPGKLQQAVLCTPPETCAGGGELAVRLMAPFFGGQFALNDSPESIARWQVYDRTRNAELPRERWSYAGGGEVRIRGERWHRYSVNFFAWRVWEEISMYNHTTNGWTSEHLMQIDPVYPETREYLRSWMRAWCLAHENADVVRFTSMFYNFVWIWGGSPRNRHLFSDWSSYDFTASPLAMELFEREYGYPLALEDFANKGLLRSGHTVPDRKKLDWMAFVNGLVIGAGRELVDIVHSFGKKAYVFYDDSWIGVEPTNGRFAEFGFDGVIKCVFSGFETRLCALPPCRAHEIRLHPYLFPVGLGGAPTFAPGGDPAADARRYWANVRRALMRQPVDRIGLGGYLHLTEAFPDFQECIAGIAREFRAIKALHGGGAPRVLRPKVAVLHAWGALRPWTLSGHFHETDSHALIHVNECLAGLPFDVSFISFDDIRGSREAHGELSGEASGELSGALDGELPGALAGGHAGGGAGGSQPFGSQPLGAQPHASRQAGLGRLAGIDVIINAGCKNSAWSGGELWDDGAVLALTEWAHEGGVFIGIGEPSALDGYDTALRMSHVLGVDIDDGRYACHGRWSYEVRAPQGLLPDGAEFSPPPGQGVLLRGEDVSVYAERDGAPALTSHRFGRGAGIYATGLPYCGANARALQNIILHASGLPLEQEGVTDNPQTECALYGESGRVAVANSSGEPQRATVLLPGGRRAAFELGPYEMAIA